jgi:hypothetical protein
MECVRPIKTCKNTELYVKRNFHTNIFFINVGKGSLPCSLKAINILGINKFEKTQMQLIVIL